MADQRLEPQLVMCRDPLAGLGPVELPAGYALRHYRGGDEEQWEAIIAESFGGGQGPYEFDKRIRSRPGFLPERVLFVARGEVLVGTASAMREGEAGREHGYLHMVGVRPAHQGRRLGHWVSLAALHRMAAEGLTRATLRTDDFRIPAIKTYLRLGFEPVLVHDSQRGRWRAVFGALGRGAEYERRYGRILNGPVLAP